MKKYLILILILSFLTANSQYSGYYTVNQNINANVNENVNVSGNINVNKNISTIDYGQLALANAQKEKTRLESIKYADEKQRRISLEMASNPLKAYDYGYQFTNTYKGKEVKWSGFKQYTVSFKIPHNSLFVSTGEGRFENVTSDGITSEIILYPPNYNKDKAEIDVEEIAKMEDVVLGQLNPIGDNGQDIFIHKKEINRAVVYGTKGFKYSLILEDDYQYTITDNFQSFEQNIGDGVSYFVKVRTYGSKNEVTFEQLEGRRYFLKQYLERLISTARVYDIKY
jgi:hypothetical protein